MGERASEWTTRLLGPVGRWDVLGQVLFCLEVIIQFKCCVHDNTYYILLVQYE